MQPANLMMMKHATLALVTLVVALGGMLAMSASPPRDDWQEVQEALKNGLPGTATQRLEPIIRRSLQPWDSGRAAKAIGLKAVLEGSVTGCKPEQSIRQLQATIQTLPAGT